VQVEPLGRFKQATETLEALDGRVTAYAAVPPAETVASEGLNAGGVVPEEAEST
jgi:hypothetical protein